MGGETPPSASGYAVGKQQAMHIRNGIRYPYLVNARVGRLCLFSAFGAGVC